MAIGAGNNYVFYEFRQEIYGNNKPERDDMIDILESYFSSNRFPVYDFSNGLPEDYDGKENKDFDFDSVITRLSFDFPVRGLVITIQGVLGREKYRGRVTATVQSTVGI